MRVLPHGSVGRLLRWPWRWPDAGSRAEAHSAARCHISAAQVPRPRLSCCTLSRGGLPSLRSLGFGTIPWTDSGATQGLGGFSGE